jgi:hypothetical protein
VLEGELINSKAAVGLNLVVCLLALLLIMVELAATR